MKSCTTQPRLFRTLRTVMSMTMAGVVVFTLPCPGASAASPEKNTPVMQADMALEAWRMDEVNALLGRLPDSPEGDYVRGIAANRNNDLAASTRALQRALPGLTRTDSAKAINALMTLVDNDQKTSAYADESNVLHEAIARYAYQMKPDDLAAVKTSLAFVNALGNSPVQTISLPSEAQIPIHRNPVGTLNVDAVANGVSAPWMLDSGANYSVVSESFARRLKLEIAGNLGEIGSATAITVAGKLAIVKEIRLGSATLHDVTVLVVSDDHLLIKRPEGNYQINAALGYPVFQALGRVSFIGEKAILIGAPSIPVTDGTPLYMHGLTPIIALDVAGASRPFILDTGAAFTSLSYAYFRQMAGVSSGWKRTQRKSAGLGGAITSASALQPEWKVRIGTDDVTLKDVEVDIVPTSGADSSPIYGRIGQDLWKHAAGFTMDFRSMRFRIDR